MEVCNVTHTNLLFYFWVLVLTRTLHLLGRNMSKSAKSIATTICEILPSFFSFSIMTIKIIDLQRYADMKNVTHEWVAELSEEVSQIRYRTLGINTCAAIVPHTGTIQINDSVMEFTKCGYYNPTAGGIVSRSDGFECFLSSVFSPNDDDDEDCDDDEECEGDCDDEECEGDCKGDVNSYPKNVQRKICDEDEWDGEMKKIASAFDDEDAKCDSENSRPTKPKSARCRPIVDDDEDEKLPVRRRHTPKNDN